jgi:hypothetical protein
MDQYKMSDSAAVVFEMMLDLTYEELEELYPVGEELEELYPVGE